MTVPFQILTVFTAITFLQAAAAQTLTCPQAVQKLKALDATYTAASGCPPPKIGASGILTPEPPGGNPQAKPCQPNTAAMKAWNTANSAEQAKLVQQIAQCDQAACPPIPLGPVMQKTNDFDQDGIPDDVEAKLIERFSPFLRFSYGHLNPADLAVPTPENFRPADPVWYLGHSRLVGVTNQATVLPQATLQSEPRQIYLHDSGQSNLLSSFLPDEAFTACFSSTPRVQFHVDPVDDAAHAGADWGSILQTHNVGLFAHVSPFHPQSEEDLPEQPAVLALPTALGQPPTLATTCPVANSGNPPQMRQCLSACARKLNGTTDVPVIPQSWYEVNCKECYKIEYYQFFGKNEDYEVLSLGDHEGDWSLITLVYDKPSDQILAVSHWAHGYEMRFDLKAAGVQILPETDPIVGQQKTYHGLGVVSQSFNILKITASGAVQDQPELAQNNTLSFAIDKVTGEYSHPVVFVEYGSHEFWPSANWGAVGAPAHPGDDPQHSYQTQNIPNLGEIEHPMGDEAAILLSYNGSWGYVNTDNNPPPGPALHKTWNWFAPNRMPISCSTAE